MKYLILGAGPAGLTFASELLKRGQDSFLVIEKECEAGGLCRSKVIDNSPLDIGGGHFLDKRNKKVSNMLFQYMPMEEWNQYERISKIQLENDMIDYPIESNIWQLNRNEQVEYLKEISKAGSVCGIEKPEKFKDWIYWKLGKKIAEEYMIPYNEKMFADQLDQLGTYWMEKLPQVSFEEVLLSCLEKKAYGIKPGHAEFFYPSRYGYGEVWRRIADSLADKVEYNVEISTIDFNTNTVTGRCGEKYTAETIINTTPWNAFKEIKGMPDQLKEQIKNLVSTSIKIDYFRNNIETDAHWIYYPNKSLPYHRILVRHNFVPGSRGYWTETRCDNTEQSKDNSYFHQYAYPLNTIDKPSIMKNLLEWCTGRSVYGLGRWGEHQHYNSDITSEKAMNLAEQLEI